MAVQVLLAHEVLLAQEEQVLQVPLDFLVNEVVRVAQEQQGQEGLAESQEDRDHLDQEVG